MKEGRRREMGLGSYPAISLVSARARADLCRQQVAEGLDPIAERDKQAPNTFGEAADKYIEAMAPSFRNEKHVAQWRMTLGDAYCKSLRPKTVASVDTHDVLSVLTPIWQSKAETASRIRGRIERVLDYAQVKGWRSGENPARWRGHLKNALPARQKLARGHHKALAYDAVPALILRLHASQGTSARGLEFLILTASRTGEVIYADFAEFDLKAAVWTVPAERMKAGKEHRVPLCDRAVEIVKAQREETAGRHVFPGEKPKAPLSSMAFAMLLRRLEIDVTTHGFRSAFRDWAGDETTYPREVAEAALAHRVGDETERAYRRSDALERRRALMKEWENFCLGKKATKNARRHVKRA
jgi:integrase